MSEINRILQKIDQLKPMPQVAHKIMAIVQDPESSMAELSDVIVYDASVTANILKVTNSAYFGLTKKIETVHQAIVFLGMDQVVDIAFMASSADNLVNAQDGYELNEGELWKYSVSSALIARELAEVKASDKAHMIFTAALLKDIGKVILNQYVADSSEEIHRLVSEQEYTFREAEKEIIGIDHAELGGIVADKWKFSPEMIEIIRNHHVPQNSTKTEFETAIVYMADTLCMMMGLGVGSDGLSYRFHQETVDRLGLGEKDFQKIIVNFGEKIGEVEELMQTT